EVEIRCRAQASDNRPRAPGGGVLDGKSSVARRFDVRPLGHRAANQVHPLFGGEEQPFIGRIVNRDYHPTEELRGPPTDVDVSIVDWIEAARIQGNQAVTRA